MTSRAAKSASARIPSAASAVAAAQNAMPSFTRAMSPSFHPDEYLIGANLDKAEAVTARAAYRRIKMGAAVSVKDFCAFVPRDYQTLLTPELLACHDDADKALVAGAALDKLQLHKQRGTLPSHLKWAGPTIQFSREYDSTAEAASIRKKVSDGINKALVAALDELIVGKTQERDLYAGRVSAQALKDRLVPLVDSIWQSIKDFKVTFVPVLQDDGLEVDRLVTDPAMLDQYQVLRGDILTIALGVVQVANGVHQARKRKEDAKKNLHNSLDVEMSEAGRPMASTSKDPIGALTLGSIQSIIDKGLNNRLAKLNLKPSGKGKSLPIVRTMTYSGRSYPQVHQRQGGQLAQQEGSQAGSSNLRLEAFAQVQGDAQEGAGSRYPVAEINVSSFVYGKPSTIPDGLLDLPSHIACQQLLFVTPLCIIEASSYKSAVHLSPGVSVPKEISYELSMGMKYMFHQPTKSSLITEAWVDFKRRLRWRLYHSLYTSDNKYATYDPDYETSSENLSEKKNLDVLPWYLDLGIKKGGYLVYNTIAKIPLEDSEDVLKPLRPHVGSIKKFLAENDYVVSPTDKNLGLAVSKRTWIIERCEELLLNVADYQPLEYVEMRQFLDRKCTEMEIIACLAEAIPWSGNLIGFLRSKITPPNGEHTLPRFYGLPKIHKVPTKMRPIIPCHSAVMNPAAKYVSKRLKPIIKSAPSIINGTKEMVQKLSTVSLDSGRRAWLCTGDVVAFYPNIPLQHCLQIVQILYDEYYLSEDHVHPIEDAGELFIAMEHELFKKCLATGNTDLITVFENKYYLQLRGLAMGVADSPDLANLYGLFFERSSIMTDSRCAFYGRYIDDLFAIVYANTQEEALQIVEQVQFDGCEIEWSAPGDMQIFLDMRIYLHDGKIHHMPYRKAHNHQERIPWTSAHPLDVKRGTFVGEMSRLAVLSSTRKHYEDAIRELVVLYVTRGYPSDLVLYWMRDNIAKRWESRLSVRETAPGEVLVLKSEYNLAWNYFSATQLGDTIMGYWREYLERARVGNYSKEFPGPDQWENNVGRLPVKEELWFPCPKTSRVIPDISATGIFDRRLIVSKKRTRNLFDLTSSWKNLVVSRLDERVLDEALEPPKEPNPLTVMHDISTHPLQYEDDDDVIQLHRRSPKTALEMIFDA